MANASLDLKRHLLRAEPARPEILYPGRGSRVRALPADANTAEGFKPSIIIMDELHAWKGRDFL